MMPFWPEPFQLVENLESTRVVPSVALMNAKSIPAALTAAQFTVPLKCVTSTPSTVVPGGHTVAADSTKPPPLRAAPQPERARRNAARDRKRGGERMLFTSSHDRALLHTAQMSSDSGMRAGRLLLLRLAAPARAPELERSARAGG